MASRFKNSVRNAAYQSISTVVTLALNFISRTVFIHYLDITYLGISGLFTDVLGVLSLAELGIGTAMVYSLYKPAAENDKETIKAYLQLYKIAYRVIAGIVAALGLLLLPFLKYIITGADGVDNLSAYYLIFLFNSVISYFVSYKFSLPTAEQKQYGMKRSSFFTC